MKTKKQIEDKIKELDSEVATLSRVAQIIALEWVIENDYARKIRQTKRD